MMECNVLNAIKDFLWEKILYILLCFRVTGCQQKIIYFFAFVLLCYFLVMDGLLFRQVQLMPRIPSWNETEIPAESPIPPGVYYVFHGLSVKMIMLDHAALYIFTPLSVVFNEVAHFSTIFYFITPNVISVVHICIAIISAKFITSDSLLHRRFGVLLFELRNFLDAFDGVIYRSQHQQAAFSSNYSSFGHFVDSIADVVGFSALLLACFFYLKRTSDRKLWGGKISGPVEPNSYPVAMRMASFTVQIIVGALAWDHFLRGYEYLLQRRLQTIQQSMLQNALLKSNMTGILMWVWRVISANGLNEFLLFSILIDKLWEFLTFMQKRGVFVLIVFALITQLHYLDTYRVMAAVSEHSL